jgi:hypothetical protein
MSEPTVPQHLLELARRARIPHALSEAGLKERFGEQADIQISAGQVWRARWNEVSVLVLVAEALGQEVTTMPLTLDPPAEDDRCLVIDPSLTVFGVEVTAWAGLSGQLPLRVLEQLVDLWPDHVVNEIRLAGESPERQALPGTRWGRPFASELSPDAMVRAELEDDLEALRHAPALPAAVEGQTPLTLSSLLGKRLDFRTLVSALQPLGLSQSEVMSLLQGKRPITLAEAEIIAGVTGLPEEEIAEVVLPLPSGFVAEVDHPRWRRTWRQRADRDGTDEATARLRESYDMFARAARQTGAEEPDWQARLTQYLRRSSDGGQERM